MLEIEFFHDVICSFCFPMSDRLRKTLNQYQNIKVTHRSFALGWEVEHFERMFGSHEAVKPEVLGHWEVANQNDDDHRFNIEGMRETDFNFPHSQPGLIAAKAVGLIGGDEMYWEIFDKFQEGLFIRNLNIAEKDVLEDLVKETSIDFDAWKEQRDKEESKQAVLDDLALVNTYGIQGAPALVIDKKYLISGAQPQAVIEQTLEQAAEEAGISIEKPVTPTFTMIGDEGSACRIVDGNWMCD
ncbi:DsbA family protein [Aerococcaceae bacterium WGS1372]